MSEDTLRKILRALPARAIEVRQRLGLSHEDTYAALVRLHDQGRARMMPDDPGTDQRRIWETA